MQAEAKPFSPRLRDALIADLVLADLGNQADHWLIQPPKDEVDCTSHLGRQLKMRSAYFSQSVHDTLLMLLRQIDELLTRWPPVYDEAVCDHLAEEATKHLAPIELYHTLLVGPGHWEKLKVEACTLTTLPRQLQSKLGKALARQLKQMLDQWVAWDIRQLRDRRRNAINSAAAAKTGTRPLPSQRVRRPPLTEKERADRVKPRFQPPGRA